MSSFASALTTQEKKSSGRVLQKKKKKKIECLRRKVKTPKGCKSQPSRQKLKFFA
jgi:hypothetical protein